jgi:hypothetical protein
MKKVADKYFAKITIILFWVLFLLSSNTWAQDEYSFVSNASFAEKIYLQLDRKVYSNGDTIWFKCILANASEHTPSQLSGVLYAELIGFNQEILEKKLIKIENGIGHGNFDLDKKIPMGNYLIRAYTQWNQNFDTNFVFEENIQVFTTGSQKLKPIDNIKLSKEDGTTDRLKVVFNPQIIDSLQKNKLNVFITVDNKKDSLEIKKQKDDQYILDYDIKKESQFATLKIQTENNKTFVKTFALNKDYIDLQFFPESGTLVHGISSKVGFKAVDANGKGKYVEGDIVDEQQTILTSFKSNALGMGSFYIANVDQNQKYFARVKSNSPSNQQTLQFSLPKVAPTGNALSVTKLNDNIHIKAQSNLMMNDSIFLKISFRGIELYEEKARLNQGIYNLTIATTLIPEGIVAFALLDKEKNPMAERLYFNEKPQTRLKINLTTDQQNYAKRSLTNLNIETTNNQDEPIKTNTSVLVISKKELGEMQNLRQNILSYFLMNSELKGSIENPGFYFNNNTNSFNDLEALMLTQGWSKYNYSKPYSNLNIAPEKSLTVSGKVNNLFLNKKVKYMTKSKTDCFPAT